MQNTCKKITYTHRLKILQSTSEFGGLWKHPNTPAYTKSVRVIELLKLDNKQMAKKKAVNPRLAQLSAEHLSSNLAGKSD